MATFTMSELEYFDGVEHSEGRCLACEAEADGVEPDARNYHCDVCGASRVFGLEELMLMGEVHLND